MAFTLHTNNNTYYPRPSVSTSYIKEKEMQNDITSWTSATAAAAPLEEDNNNGTITITTTSTYTSAAAITIAPTSGAIERLLDVLEATEDILGPLQTSTSTITAAAGNIPGFSLGSITTAPTFTSIEQQQQQQQQQEQQQSCWTLEPVPLGPQGVQNLVHTIPLEVSAELLVLKNKIDRDALLDALNPLINNTANNLNNKNNISNNNENSLISLSSSTMSGMISMDSTTSFDSSSSERTTSSMGGFSVAAAAAAVASTSPRFAALEYDQDELLLLPFNIGSSSNDNNTVKTRKRAIRLLEESPSDAAATVAADTSGDARRYILGTRQQELEPTAKRQRSSSTTIVPLVEGNKEKDFPTTVSCPRPQIFFDRKDLACSSKRGACSAFNINVFCEDAVVKKGGQGALTRTAVIQQQQQQQQQQNDDDDHKAMMVSNNSSSTTTTMTPPSSKKEEVVVGDVQKQQHGHFRPYQYDQWNHKLQELIDFQAEHGHCLVPHNFPPNQQLAQWVKRQRYQYKLKQQGLRSTITDDRQMILENMGFVWDSHQAIWVERFEELKIFKAKHSHCSVPANYDDRSLAIWVKCQRRQYKLYQQGCRSSMTQDRFQQLEELGFDWNPRKL